MVDDHTDKRRAGGGRLLFGGKSVGRYGHVKELYPDTLDFIFLAIVFTYLFCGSLYFPFSVCFGNLDMEYRFQLSNLFIDEEVGG